MDTFSWSSPSPSHAADGEASKLGVRVEKFFMDSNVSGASAVVTPRVKVKIEAVQGIHDAGNRCGGPAGCSF